MLKILILKNKHQRIYQWFNLNYVVFLLTFCLKLPIGSDVGTKFERFLTNK
jgi:hypothetical protein